MGWCGVGSGAFMYLKICVTADESYSEVFDGSSFVGVVEPTIRVSDPNGLFS